MVELKEISIDATEWFIYIAFAEDKDLLVKYHTREKTLDELISNLIGDIEVVCDVMGMKCYAVVFDGEPIGFSVFNDVLLFSFGIEIHFRRKDILIEWFGELKKKMSSGFATCLYNENERAISFFKKNGMHVKVENDEFNLLVYN